MTELGLKILNSEKGKTHIFFIGQAGFIIKSASEQLLGIDLYLSDCVERLEGHIGFKRLIPHIIEADDLIFNCIIATHAHWDHFDVDSIPKMVENGTNTLFVSLNCNSLVQKTKIKNEYITYVKSGDEYNVGDFKLFFVNCDHGEAAPDAVGVVIKVDEKIIYETGDTCLRLDRIDEYKKFGQFDMIMAPINGAYGNMNAKECAMLAHKLNPTVTVPCHYGMFASHGGNPREFIEIMNTCYPDNKYILMCPGERYTFD